MMVGSCAGSWGDVRREAPKLDAHQQKEALKRLLAGESARALGRSYKVHHVTISRLRERRGPCLRIGRGQVLARKGGRLS